MNSSINNHLELYPHAEREGISPPFVMLKYIDNGATVSYGFKRFQFKNETIKRELKLSF